MTIIKEIPDGLKITGTPSMEELEKTPSFKLPEKGTDKTVAVIECIEEIPCNPCETSCPQGAITVGSEITSLPEINTDKCTACGICVAACPGLAIYLKNPKYKDSMSMIAFPYEYYPLPEKDQQIEMVNRFGEVVCGGTVLKVINAKRNDKTAVIYALYPDKYYEKVINMKRL